jgi:hypothetical protein
MPRIVNRIFKDIPTLYKIDIINGSKKISDILSKNDYQINIEQQLIIKKLLGINNKKELIYIANKNGLLYLKNDNNNYIVSILNNTFMIN